MSLRMLAVASSGVVPSASMPRLAKSFTTSGSRVIGCSACDRRFRTSAGTPPVTA